MHHSAPLLAAIAMSVGLAGCSAYESSVTDQGLVRSVGDGGGVLDAGSTAPDAAPLPPPPDAAPLPPPPDATPPPPPPPPPSCSGESTSVAPKPGVNAFVCVTATDSLDGSIGSYTVVASFQIDGSYFGSPGMIAGSLGLDAVLATDDAGNSSVTIVDETSGAWTRDGIAMSASDFAVLWSAVAPGQAAPSPGGSMVINVTVALDAVVVAINAAVAPDPCQADANNLDAAATVYNITVGGSILGAAAIGLLEVPTLGAATGGFIGLSAAVITAKVNYNAACKNFQLCCKNNNWPAGVCRPKGAKRRGCKNNG
jgi:hypothetical protein